MTENFILGSATALLLTSAASAEFIGFDGVVSINDAGNNVVQMYAVYDNDSAVVLNVFESDISAGAAGDILFNQSDVQMGAGGTWSPSASLDIPDFADSSNDSYVTIGYGVGAAANTNGTALDTQWRGGGFLGGTVPVGAGWYNSYPPNEQVASAFAGGIDGLSGYAVMVGQFVWSGDAVFSFEATVGANAGAGSDFEFGSDLFIIPAPGALALLGLGGLAARRRRG